MGLYAAVGRPLFFSLPPEAAHRVAGAMLGLPLPWRRIGHAVEDPALATDLAGLRLRNPIGLAAGFDKSCAHLHALGELGFGYVVGRHDHARRPRREPEAADRARPRSSLDGERDGPAEPRRRAGRRSPAPAPRRARPEDREPGRRGPRRRGLGARAARAARRRDRAERQLPERLVGARHRQRDAPAGARDRVPGPDGPSRCS